MNRRCSAKNIIFVRHTLNYVVLNKKLFFTALFLLTAGLFLADLRWGSVSLSWDQWRAVWSGEYGPGDVSYEIIWHYRLPKALTALWTGAALGLAGLLMQTLFRNPITGPYVLGISSGAGLAVAVWLLGAGWLMGSQGAWTMTLAAAAGAMAVLFFDLWLYRRTGDTVTLLVAGLMIGTFSGAVLSLLTYWAPAKQLQKYVFWTLGNLGNVPRQGILLMMAVTLLAYIWSWRNRIPLDGHLLGEAYVASAGYSLRYIHRMIILAAGLLTGVVTAFVGPVAFVGLMVPHLVYLGSRSRLHRYTIPAVFLAGAALMLAADLIAQLPGSEGVLPINSITSLIGAPMVIWLLLKRK